MNLLLAVMTLSFLDVSLTATQLFFLEKKVGKTIYKYEKNPLFSRMLRKGFSSIRFLIFFVIVQLIIISLWFWIIPSLRLNRTVLFLVLLGMFVLLNHSHILQLLSIKKNWSNKEFWKLEKRIMEIKK